MVEPSFRDAVEATKRVASGASTDHGGRGHFRNFGHCSPKAASKKVFELDCLEITVRCVGRIFLEGAESAPSQHGLTVTELIFRNHFECAYVRRAPSKWFGQIDVGHKAVRSDAQRPCGPVAHLDRALASEARRNRIESCRDSQSHSL